jgi:hypothetical protein
MKTKTSLVYKNIFFYRFLMNALYLGNYKNRFLKIIEVIEQESPNSIVELCFGDTFIAAYCHKKNIAWRGIDINAGFVERAQEKGYDAVCDDILLLDSFRKNELCIISGSLYHFNPSQRLTLFQKMFSSSKKILISEPIRNLSDQKGFIGSLARRSANAGKGHESFRYNEQSLKAVLNELSRVLNFTFNIVGFIEKDIIILLEKNGTS